MIIIVNCIGRVKGVNVASSVALASDVSDSKDSRSHLEEDLYQDKGQTIKAFWPNKKTSVLRGQGNIEYAMVFVTRICLSVQPSGLHV